MLKFFSKNHIRKFNFKSLNHQKTQNLNLIKFGLIERYYEHL